MSDFVRNDSQEYHECRLLLRGFSLGFRSLRSCKVRSKWGKFTSPVMPDSLVMVRSTSAEIPESLEVENGVGSIGCRAATATSAVVPKK